MNTSFLGAFILLACVSQPGVCFPIRSHRKFQKDDHQQPPEVRLLPSADNRYNNMRYDNLAVGPIKQDLTAHVGPVLLAMFTSVHYTGKDLNTEYRNGEPWKKMKQEVKNWPYSFPQSKDFPPSNKRGSVSGQLLIRDGSIKSKSQSGSWAYVGLANPGAPASWQYDSKGYQFWTRADRQGNFSIRNVRPGVYRLYAWAPGFIGDYTYGDALTIQPGRAIHLPPITFTPPRNGPTIWDIGYPDRSAQEFFIPSPMPAWINKLFVNQPANRHRQYGLSVRYTQLYPKNDLVYQVGVNDYKRDWLFAQVTRDIGNKTYLPTTWQIKFGLHNVTKFQNYTLQLALAAATASTLQVRFNDQNRKVPHFSTDRIGKDNAIARHGIHGLYRLYSLKVPGDQLNNGSNTIFLTQAEALSTWEGVLYDYIRLEGPRQS